MRIAVTGSIATDHLMTFPGRFTDQLIADKLDKVSLSFLVDDLAIRRGGVAANIAFGLGVLGLRPLLVGAVGPDFGDYRHWLEEHGVSTAGVRESLLRHTARFVCTTDADGNQIGSFYAGAMAEDGEIRIAPLAESQGGIDLVLIGAGDPGAMVVHTAECRDVGLPFAADPSQQLARILGDEQVRALVDGAEYLFGNEYEEALIERKSGWTAAEILARVGVRITTLGPGGARIEQAGRQPVTVPAVPDAKPADPTGSGDAFRSGFLAGVAWGLPLERCAQLGNLMAVHALESTGPQEYNLKPGPLTDRFAAAYGDDAAADVAAHLPA
ncbi:MAG TPA: carbohydrate kinase family protein [Streptosporangiaceae bacterium]|nr:carbohydrate kinase family protein [Streptosporangiaceae bacterium]